MVFNSWAFAVLMAAFVPLYALVRGNVRRRNILLIVVSYIFYGWWSWKFLILVALSTGVDYAAALGASGARVTRADVAKGASLLSATAAVAFLADLAVDPLVLALVIGAVIVFVGFSEIVRTVREERRRRFAWLIFSLVLNFSVLGVFKYFNFFLSSLEGAAGALGWTFDLPTLRIILPVGLSFYTFQSVSRTIDSYRGVFQPKRSIVDYAAFHAFFPQLVAGPIERAGHLMPQFESVRPMRFALIRSGLFLFLWGLFQKIVVADNIAPLADAVFNAPAGKSGAESLVAVLAFSVQVYGDFCGYSNMARGVARVIGFDLIANFDLPYFSRTPQEFWQRWHISLSRWLRDYLYIPLGGSRHGEPATYRNLMITMVLGGLWHGAAWTFVAWGAFHGAIQVVFRALGLGRLIEAHDPRRPLGLAVHLFFWLVTSILVAIGWVFFRARGFGDATQVLANLLSPSGYSIEAFRTLGYYTLPLVVVEIWQRFRPAFPWPLRTPPFLMRYSAGVLLVTALALLSAQAGKQFIYFDF